jgi:hypothetical protein
MKDEKQNAPEFPVKELRPTPLNAPPSEERDYEELSKGKDPKRGGYGAWAEDGTVEVKGGLK